MFRNGFNATRRSLFIITHPRALPLPKKDLSRNSFVCILCQFRSLHSKQAKRGKGTKPETFLGAVRRLEAHVQHIEKTYLDRVRQHEELKVRLYFQVPSSTCVGADGVRLLFRNYQIKRSPKSFRTAPTPPSWRPQRPHPLSSLYLLQ